MESKREKKRAKFYRAIAWSISITLHVAVIYYLGVLSSGPEASLEDHKETIAKVE